MQKATQRLVIRDGYMRWAAYAAGIIVVVVVVVVDFGPWPTEHSGRAAVGERSEWQRRTWILSSGGNTFWWTREASPVRGPPECRVSIGSLAYEIEVGVADNDALHPTWQLYKAPSLL